MRKSFIAVLFFGVASLKPAMASPRIIPINIVDLAAEDSVDAAAARGFVRTLNAGFRDRDREVIFDFDLAAFYRAEGQNYETCRALMALGDQLEKPARDDVEAAFSACDDGRLRSRRAINVYLFRSSWDVVGVKSSRIYFNAFEPFVFMNVDRLPDDWRVWEHEFGHVFGMPEMDVCGSTPTTPTNIMAHPSDAPSCVGSGGNRALGFEPWQVAVMKATAAIVTHRFHASADRSGG